MSDSHITTQGLVDMLMDMIGGDPSAVKTYLELVEYIGATDGLERLYWSAYLTHGFMTKDKAMERVADAMNGEAAKAVAHLLGGPYGSK